jgi:hypothetical protein
MCRGLECKPLDVAKYSLLFFDYTRKIRRRATVMCPSVKQNIGVKILSMIMGVETALTL